MTAEIPADTRDQICLTLEKAQASIGYEWRNHLKTLRNLLGALSDTALSKVIELQQVLESGKLETYVVNPLGEIQGKGLAIDLECAVVQRLAIEYEHIATLKTAIVTELESAQSAAAPVTAQLTKELKS